MEQTDTARPPRGLDQRVVELPAGLLAAIAAGLVILAGAGVALGMRGPTPGPVGMSATLALSFAPLGVFALRRLPGHPIGRLMLLTGAVAAIAALSVCWSAAVPLAWLSQWSWWPPLALIPLILLVMPDGQLPARAWRFLGAVLVGAGAVTTLALAVAALARPTSFLTTFEPLPPAVQLLARLALGGVGVVVLATVGVLIALFVRWRGADALQRRQLACLLPSAAVLVVGLVLDYENVPWAWLAAVTALPLGITVAALRYQLHDLDLYVHRGSVWLVLSGLGVAVYAVSATVLGRTLATADQRMTLVVAVGAAAAVLHPAERLVRRVVGRLLYGRRDEPYAVLTQMGRHLENVTNPLAVLPEFAATLVDGLRVPYAAIVLGEPDGSRTVAAEYGRRAGEPQRFAMTAHGDEVGELLVTPRRPGEHFTTAELRLLRDLATQAAQAAITFRSTLDLQRARERLVLAREEERRRLRHDLHDGIASALVGARMLTEAANELVPADKQVYQMLKTLAMELDTCTAEIRTVVDGLRPAALDDGLEPALRALAQRLPQPGAQFFLHVEGELVDLPAAVEVATYRIVTEAVTNVVKHARATRCSVVLTRDEGRLEVTVTDDGQGLETAARLAGSGSHAVGLSSIRSRAEELGGVCDIRPTPEGTSLRVVLPTGA